MHIKEKHLQLLPTLQNALLAVAVFCYWMWIAPHLLFTPIRDKIAISCM